MTKIVRHFALCAVCLATLLLPELSIADTPEAIPNNFSAPLYRVLSYPIIKTVNGICLVQQSRMIDNVDTKPTLTEMEFFGFTINPDDEDTYLTPDGTIIPAFHSGLWVLPPNADKFAPENTPSSYLGEMYLPDKSRIYEWSDLEFYLLGCDPVAFAEELTAIRTPIYMPVMTLFLMTAVDLQKAQFGTFFVIEPDALKYCTKLETVFFERDPYIYNTAFSNCSNLKTIVLLDDKRLPMLESASSFAENVYSTATLYLPDSLMDDCVNDPVWSKFAHIKSLKDSPVELMKPQL